MFIIRFILLLLFSFNMAFAKDDEKATSATKAVLKIDSTPISVVGRSVCKSTQLVHIGLLSSKYTTYRVIRKLGKEKQKASVSLCPSKITSKTEMAIFTSAKPSIEQKHLLSDVACSTNGEQGSAVLCIYPGEDEEDDLFAYAEYSFNTLKVKIEKIYDKSAYNGRLSFKLAYEPSQITILGAQTCYGEDNTADIINDSCPTGFKLQDTDFSDKTEYKVDITGLTNNMSYIFKVRLKISSSDYSDWTPVYGAHVVKASGPAEAYDGNATDISFGNCQQGESSLVVFLLLIVVVMIKKNWFKHLSKLLMILMFLGFMPKNKLYAEIGQMSFGVVGSMYRPDLDNEKKSDGTKIFPFYKCFFCKDTKDKQGAINPLIGLEFDWNVFESFGTIQTGFALAYTYKSGRYVEEDANNKPDCSKPIKNAEINLHMYQVRPQVTYLMDYFVDYFPLFPYIKGSLIGHGFIFRDKDKQIDKTTHFKPNGFVFGWQAAVGLMLRLDFLEPSAVSDARVSGTFEQVYLRADLSYSEIQNFSNKGYRFTPQDIMGTKYPLQWNFGLVFKI